MSSDLLVQQLALQCSVSGIMAASNLPNHRSYFEAPLHPNCNEQHYGMAFFYAGTKADIDKVREFIQKEIGLHEVTEDSRPIYESIIRQMALTHPNEGSSANPDQPQAN